MNTSGNEGGPALYADELTIYFYCGSPQNFDLCRATRGDRRQSFGAPEHVNALDSSSSDINATFARDDTTVVFASDRIGGAGGRDLYVSTRSASGDWGDVSQVAALNSAADEHVPEFSKAGDAIYFSSKRAGGKGGYDLFASSFNGTGFTPPEALDALNSDADDIAGVVAPDETTVWFSSNRPGGPGSFDVYVATRVDRHAAWSAPAVAPELSSPGYDAPYWISPDGCRLYLGSMRDGGQGGFDVYVAERSP